MRHLPIGKLAASMLGGMERLFASETQDRPSDVPVSDVCGECGGSVLSEWRLCPHCGYGLTPGADGSAPSKRF